MANMRESTTAAFIQLMDKLPDGYSRRGTSIHSCLCCSSKVKELQLGVIDNSQLAAQLSAAGWTRSGQQPDKRQIKLQIRRFLHLKNDPAVSRSPALTSTQLSICTGDNNKVFCVCSPCSLADTVNLSAETQHLPTGCLSKKTRFLYFSEWFLMFLMGNIQKQDSGLILCVL